MCDYSLHHVASRPATVGDKVVTTKFVNTPTGGFAALNNANVAVCLRPGTELAFEHDVECEPILGILPSSQNRSAPGALPANQHGATLRPSRRAGIPRR